MLSIFFTALCLLKASYNRLKKRGCEQKKMLPPCKRQRNWPANFWYFTTFVIRILKEFPAQKSRGFFPVYSWAQKWTFKFLIFRYICSSCDSTSQRIVCLEITSFRPCKLSRKVDLQFFIYISLYLLLVWFHFSKNHLLRNHIAQKSTFAPCFTRARFNSQGIVFSIN